MAEINAYLHFNGNCREAMTFYHECLGGRLLMQPVAETPAAAAIPEEKQDLILHASLNKGRLAIMASDMAGPGALVSGNTISLTLICSSTEEINRYFNKLSSGGQVVFPLSEQSWGATYGELTDKYGINWMLNFDKRGI